MKRWMVVALFLGAASAAFGGAAEGKDLYAKKCRACHGPEGHGNPGMAKMLKVEFRHLGSKDVQGKPDEEIKKIITAGTGKMKAVDGLSGNQIKDLLAFIRTLKN